MVQILFGISHNCWHSNGRLLGSLSARAELIANKIKETFE